MVVFIIFLYFIRIYNQQSIFLCDNIVNTVNFNYKVYLYV